MRFDNTLGIHGIFSIYEFSERPTLENGLLDVSDGARMSVCTVKNTITIEGRKAIAAILSGERTGGRVAGIELGCGAYGIGVQYDNSFGEPPTASEHDDSLNVPIANSFIEIDQQHGILTPANNPSMRTYTVIIDPIPTNFDDSKYYGISEFGLKIRWANGDPDTLLAVKRRKPIQPSSETFFAIQWSIQY